MFPFIVVLNLKKSYSAFIIVSRAKKNRHLVFWKSVEKVWKALQEIWIWRHLYIQPINSEKFLYVYSTGNNQQNVYVILNLPAWALFNLADVLLMLQQFTFHELFDTNLNLSTLMHTSIVNVTGQCQSYHKRCQIWCTDQWIYVLYGKFLMQLACRTFF